MESQGLHRRNSSSGSSSSFDSCSDLLSSFDLAEKVMMPDVGLQREEEEKEGQEEERDQGHEDEEEEGNLNVLSSQESESCNKEISDPSHLDVLSGQEMVVRSNINEVLLKGSDSAEVEVTNDFTQSQVIRDNSMTSVVRDHIYGFSSAMTLSMVRSLAENTVGRISQLHTSLRIPSSYIFSTKSAESAEYTLSLDQDQANSKSSDNDSIRKEISDEGLPVPNLDGSTLVQDMQKNDSNNIIGKESMQEKESLEGDHSGSETNIGNDTSGGLNSSELFQFLSGKNQSEISEGSGHNDLVGTQNGNQTGGSTDIEREISDGLHSGEVLTGNEKVDPVYIEKDISEGLHSDNLIQITNGNQREIFNNMGENISEDSGSGDLLRFLNGNLMGKSASLAKDVPEILISNTLIPCSEMSEFSEEAHDKTNSGTVSQKQFYGLLCNREIDEDLSWLESSIKLFESQRKTPVGSHPLHILNSGSGRPDLEEVDYDIASAERWKNQPPSSSSPPDDVKSHKSHADEQLVRDERDFSRNSLSLYKTTGGASALDAMFQYADSARNDQMHIEAAEILALKFRESDHLSRETWKGMKHKDRDELFRYVENLDLNGTDVDTIIDMEDILLNADEDGNKRSLFLPSSMSLVGTPRSSRDGSLSSSTSGLFGLHAVDSLDHFPSMIDWIEVIGAKQKKGGSSFGERVVGVKDHTVYCIKVRNAEQEWEVIRRYRDFVGLYHQLKHKFNARSGKCLPSPWKEVESESRKVFGGTTPNVIEIRSTRIEKCLQSLLEAGPPLSNSSPLHRFLRPQGVISGSSGFEDQESVAMSMSRNSSDVQLGALDSPRSQSPRLEAGSGKVEVDHARGKTIKLVLKVYSNKNLKQLLSSQRYSCAGCHKHLDVEKGLVQGFVQTLGWGRPRLCEYSGQLYCTSCHLNETAVLPAQVLWHWDFKPRRVSQLAKAYLDSIYDQPMLCVSAVNPHLYSRVPILMHVKETRRRVSRIVACMQCPSHSRIQQTMGSRKYLLENDDFFALRDLEDLSKGAFAVLPGLLSMVSGSLTMHITKQCSFCQDVGVLCAAGDLCEDPLTPIFPFQEENVKSCKDCRALYHKACFSKCISCPSCPRDSNSKESTIQGLRTEEDDSSIGNQAEISPVVNDAIIDKNPSASSSSTKGAELEGPSETLRPSQSYWPSFSGLLPTWKSRSLGTPS